MEPEAQRLTSENGRAPVLQRRGQRVAEGAEQERHKALCLRIYSHRSEWRHRCRESIRGSWCNDQAETSRLRLGGPRDIVSTTRARSPTKGSCSANHGRSDKSCSFL